MDSAASLNQFPYAKCSFVTNKKQFSKFLELCPYLFFFFSVCNWTKMFILAQRNKIFVVSRRSRQIPSRRRHTHTSSSTTKNVVSRFPFKEQTTVRKKKIPFPSTTLILRDKIYNIHTFTTIRQTLNNTKRRESAKIYWKNAASDTEALPFNHFFCLRRKIWERNKETTKTWLNIFRVDLIAVEWIVK